MKTVQKIKRPGIELPFLQNETEIESKPVVNE